MLRSALLSQKTGVVHGFTTKDTSGTSHLYTIGSQPSQIQTSSELERNITALRQGLGAGSDTPVALLRQVHGNDVIVLDSSPELGQWPVGDALITKVPNLVIGVQTADCIPLLIYEPEARIVAAIHAGWRGVAKNIVGKSVARLTHQGADPAKVTVVLGPSIQRNSYEVGEDVRSELMELGNYAEYFTFLKDGKYLLDLPGIVKAQLVKMGIKSIDDLQLDTYTSPQFFSHRAHTHGKQQEVGRMVALISLC